MIGPPDVERLLYGLCIDFGFCLPLSERNRLCAAPPQDISAFVDAVYWAEGIDPRTANQRVYRLVHAAVDAALRGAESNS